MLETELNHFNPFNVLKIEKYEIRHSNVLAWLLNPSENHGLKDYFLKKIISQMVLKNEEVFGVKINLTEIHFADFSDSIVKREEGNIDILLLSDSNKLILLIENKINSKESEHQIANYLKYTDKNYPDFRIIPLLLTKFGDEPKDKVKIGVFTHEEIYKQIIELLRHKGDILKTEVVSFLKFYLKTLQKNLGMDEELKKLCLKIYENHKHAIDMIMTSVVDNKTSLKPTFDEFISNFDIEKINYNDTVLFFLPKDIIEIFKQVNINLSNPYPIFFWISKNGDERIKFVIEVGQFSKGENRASFMEHLYKEGYRISSKSKELGSKYTRIFSCTEKVKDFTNSIEVIEIVEKIYKENISEVARIRKAINDYNWKE